jgi:lipopolysaccharide export system protein LptC
LNGKAIINRDKAEGSKELTINTSNLRVKIETSYAETDEWAELLSPPNITTGIGMKMTFVAPVHLELLANVKGKYETNK